MKEDTEHKPITVSKVFDPRIIEEGNQRIWSSESVYLAEKGISEGYKLVENPFNSFVKGYNLRKDNLPFKYSEDELNIIRKASQDKVFFGNNFVHLKFEDIGWCKVKLRDYQENLLNRYSKYRWNILLFPRQSGKTTTTIVEIVHFLCFNIDKDVVVIAQSDKVVTEILNKIKECFSRIPFFMQPGVISFTKDKIFLDNGCRLSIGVASESVVQGFSLDLVYIDEFAYIRSSLITKFWNNIVPSISNNPKSRIIITSTPNGRNLFYKLWTDAIMGANKFKPFRIYVEDVPRKQSLEDFKAEMISLFGIEGWLQGFECSFDVGLKSIFDTKMQGVLRNIQKENEEFWPQRTVVSGTKMDSEDDSAILGGRLDWVSKDKIHYNTALDYFGISLDISEGLGQDFSVIKINKIDWDIVRKKVVFKTVGVFHGNMISVEELARELLDTLKKYSFNLKKIKIVTENNTFGAEFFATIKSLILFGSVDGVSYSWCNMDIFAKFYRTSKKDLDFGIRWSEDNKKIAVKALANMVSTETFISTHTMTIEEYLNFGRQENGTYSTNYGNDDLVMADVTLCYWAKYTNVFTIEFLKNAEEYIRLYYNDKSKKQIEKEIQEEKDKKDGRYEPRKGYVYHIRNHEKELKKQNLDDFNYL